MRATSPFDRVVKKELKLPNWLEPIAEIPKRKDVLTNAALFGALGLIPIFNAQLASTSITVGFAMSLFKLFNRGAPEAQAGSDEEMMELSMRPPKARELLVLCRCGARTLAATTETRARTRQVKPLALSAGITFMAACIGAATSLVIYEIIGIAQASA